jgi:hypothetical protein
MCACSEIPTEVRSGVGILRQRVYVTFEVFANSSIRWLGMLLAPFPVKGGSMKILRNQQGAIGWVLLWLLGIPIPILLILFLVRGCT